MTHEDQRYLHRRVDRGDLCRGGVGAGANLVRRLSGPCLRGVDSVAVFDPGGDPGAVCWMSSGKSDWRDGLAGHSVRFVDHPGGRFPDTGGIPLEPFREIARNVLSRPSATGRFERLWGRLVSGADYRDRVLVYGADDRRGASGRLLYFGVTFVVASGKKKRVFF